MSRIAVYLTEEDHKLLTQFLEQLRTGRINPPIRTTTEYAWDEREDHQAPEAVIVKTPPEGIGGRSGDVMDEALCDVYQEYDHFGNPILDKVPGFQVDVHNPSESSLPGNSYILALRDKFGIWLAVAGGGGSLIRFEIKKVENEGTGDWRALVDITARPCGVTVVPQEDNYGRVWVYDPCHCFLDEPEQDLIGRCGGARYMQEDLTPGTSTAGGTGTGPCRWEIDWLCCPSC